MRPLKRLCWSTVFLRLPAILLVSVVLLSFRVKLSEINSIMSNAMFRICTICRIYAAHEQRRLSKVLLIQWKDGSICNMYVYSIIISCSYSPDHRFEESESWRYSAHLLCRNYTAVFEDIPNNIYLNCHQQHVFHSVCVQGDTAVHAIDRVLLIFNKNAIIISRLYILYSP